MSSEFDILVAGQIVADILVHPVDTVDYGVDTQRVEGIRLANGGDAMNVAVDMAKLGSRVAFCGCVGDDAFGAFLLETLDRHKIDTSALKRLGSAGTSTCLCLINTGGDRCFFYCGGANNCMTQDLVPEEMLMRCRAVHIGGTFLLPGLDGEGAARLFGRARACGLHTSMDVTWDTTGRWDGLIAPCYPYLDLFMPSLNEAKHIAGTDNPVEIADFFIARGVKTVVVKLGEKGCFVKDGSGQFYAGVYPVEPVDTTGAGDAFAAGFLHARLRGEDLNGCAQWGAAAAAQAIGEIGATAGVPDGPWLERWMKTAAYQP